MSPLLSLWLNNLAILLMFVFLPWKIQIPSTYRRGEKTPIEVLYLVPA
jgi:hypothetical protein